MSSVRLSPPKHRPHMTAQQYADRLMQPTLSHQQYMNAQTSGNSGSCVTTNDRTPQMRASEQTHAWIQFD